MDKQAQDKLWNELSQESKKIVLNAFGNIDSALNGKCIDAQGIKHFMNTLFGTHNLNPEPPTPKTWEDVEKENEVIRNIYKELEFHIHKDLPYKEHDLIRRKILATYQIQQLIDLRYGGMVSEEEWKDFYTPKYGIYCNQKGELIIGTISIETEAKRTLIAFHTEFQLKDFMSHESNRKLVEMYYLM